MNVLNGRSRAIRDRACVCYTDICTYAVEPFFIKPTEICHRTKIKCIVEIFLNCIENVLYFDRAVDFY